MLGRFLELGIAVGDIAVGDIAESVQFYERLGFSQLITGDAWPHRYGVLSDGRLHLGLHEQPMPSPALTFVLPQLARAQLRLRTAGFELRQLALGDSLHQMRLTDPGGNAVTLLEARTYSPAAPGSGLQSLCGYFSHLSLPQADWQAAREFWERGGFVALDEEPLPYPHLPLTSDNLDLAFHAPRLFGAPLLVFECADVGAHIARLRERGIGLATQLPRGLDHERSALVSAPEGTALLLVHSPGN
jgi:catechol 2,3-dioxygenase-like lactoylglutathione lyase family enzyme